MIACSHSLRPNLKGALDGGYNQQKPNNRHTFQEGDVFFDNEIRYDLEIEMHHGPRAGQGDQLHFMECQAQSAHLIEV